MDYDFTENYSKGDTVYQVRCIAKLDIKEVNRLVIGNSVNKTYMVGYKENKEAVMIGKDWIEKDLIFTDRKDANARLKVLSKNMKAAKKKNEIPSQLIGLDEEEDENLDSYIDGDGEDE
jgi:hypothetical protein